MCCKYFPTYSKVVEFLMGEEHKNRTERKAKVVADVCRTYLNAALAILRIFGRNPFCVNRMILHFSKESFQDLEIA